MTNENAIRILSSETSLDAVTELRQELNDDKDRVIAEIQKAMDAGAEAIRKVEIYEETVEIVNGLIRLLDKYDNDWICDMLRKDGCPCEEICGDKGDTMRLCYIEYIRRFGNKA